jgi:histidinol phosphatase-like PHP family hydrolase
MALYEIHSHTKEVSGCSSVNGATLVDEHKKEGFEGVCITDHFYKGYFDQFEGKSYKYKIDHYLSGYRNAKKRGDEIGLQVFLGMEIRFNGDMNDYLVFGMTEQFLYDYADMYKMTVESFSKFIKDSDIIMIWAHPFRNEITMKDHNNFEAIETFNEEFTHKINYWSELK